MTYHSAVSDMPFGGSVSDYISLLKPRVMGLSIFTAFCGLLVAPGSLNPLLAFIAVLCIGIGAGGAGVLNMWFDSDIDVLMPRTRGRAIPLGRISSGEAFIFGMILSIGSVVMMGLFLNWFSAFLLGLTIFYYVVIYTMWLKRRYPQSVVIGGVAGALPPVIGWSSVTGDLGFGALALFLLIFVWTPPHSWALTLFESRSYARAGIPMLSVVSGFDRTRVHILLWSFFLIPVGLLPWYSGISGSFHGFFGLALGFVFFGYVLHLCRCEGTEMISGSARRLFRFSIVYLFCLFALLPLERMIVFVAPIFSFSGF